MPKQRNRVASLPVIEPNAAGIDVGATEIFVAVLRIATQNRSGASPRSP